MPPVFDCLTSGREDVRVCQKASAKGVTRATRNPSSDTFTQTTVDSTHITARDIWSKNGELAPLGNAARRPRPGKRGCIAGSGGARTRVPRSGRSITGAPRAAQGRAGSLPRAGPEGSLERRRPAPTENHGLVTCRSSSVLQHGHSERVQRADSAPGNRSASERLLQ